MAANKRKRVDWESVEPLYRAGALSNCEICRQYAADHIHSQTWKIVISEAAIRAHAKKKCWLRNIADKVKNQIRENLVRGEIREAALLDPEIVLRAAEKPTQVRMLQRVRAIELADLGDKLKTQLTEQFTDPDVEVIPLWNRVQIFNALVGARDRLQKMENIAFGLDDSSSDTGKDHEKMLDELE